MEIDRAREEVSRKSQRYEGLEAQWDRQKDSMRRMEMNVVVAMALMAAQGAGPTANLQLSDREISSGATGTTKRV